MMRAEFARQDLAIFGYWLSAFCGEGHRVPRRLRLRLQRCRWRVNRRPQPCAASSSRSLNCGAPDGSDRAGFPCEGTLPRPPGHPRLPRVQCVPWRIHAFRTRHADHHRRHGRVDRGLAACGPFRRRLRQPGAGAAAALRVSSRSFVAAHAESSQFL